MKKKIYKVIKINELARQIEEGKIEETKEILMLQNKEGDSVAHYLAWNSDITNWSTDDSDILRLQDSEGDSVAHYLAACSYTTKWSTKDEEILMLQNRYGISVAYNLAWNHPTWNTENIEILSLASLLGRTVEDILIKRRGR